MVKEQVIKEGGYMPSGTNRMSEDIRQLAQAFLLAKREFVATGKSARNEHQKYSYAKIGDIYNAVEEALIKNNIWIVHSSEVRFESPTMPPVEILYTRLIHSLSGQFIEDARLIESEKPGNQAKGAANTYVKKFAVLSLCAISAEDDDAQEEERYIAKKASEPRINEIQIKVLQDEIKGAENKLILYNNILKFNRVKDLNELMASQFEQVKSYIIKHREP